MTQRLTLSALALALIAALTFSISGPAAHAEPEHGEHHGGHEILEHNMKVIGSAYKKLRTQARSKAFGESTIKLLSQMQSAAVIAMHANVDAEITKKEDVIAYRTQMADLIKKLLDTELAVLNGKNDEAASNIGDLYRIEKKGHRQFRKED